MGEVQPVLGPALAVMRAFQEPVHQPLIGVAPRVFQEGGNLSGRGRQTGQVVRHAADQGDLVGLRPMRKLDALHLGQGEPVDRIANPAHLANRRGLGPFLRLIGPVLLLIGREGLGRRLRPGGLPLPGPGDGLPGLHSHDQTRPRESQDQAERSLPDRTIHGGASSEG